MVKTDKEWEEELIRHGWEKKHGWKVDTSVIGDDYDYVFFEELSEFAEECDYWVNDSEELAHDFEGAVETTLDWIEDAKRDHYEDEEATKKQ